MQTKTKLIPLDEDDIIGCVLRSQCWTWGHVVPLEVWAAGVRFIWRGTQETVTFAKLQADNWRYHRPGEVGAEGEPVWRRCEKRVEA